MNDRVYLFLDESGNLDFSTSGTRYFVLTSVSMKRPFQINNALDDYKYDCIESGANIEHFHCYHDRKAVRNVVFTLIGSYLESMHIDYLLIEKSRVPSKLRYGARFYPTVLGRLLNLVLRTEIREESSPEVIVITDSIPVNNRRRSVEKAIRTTLASSLPGLPFRVLHHQSRSHYGLQIADYFSWAIFRKHTMKDDTHFSQIRSALRNELRMF
jgi:hypothetical protein